MKNLTLILPLLLLAGCQSTQPPVVDIAPLSAQIGHVTEANGELQIANERLKVANSSLLAENEQLKSVLRADADAGLAANTKGWLPFEKYVWGHQIVLLPVTPDADTTAKWTEASMLYEKGGESAMLGVVNTLTQQAGVLNSELGKLKQSVETAQTERDLAQVKAAEALQKAKDATANLAKAVKDAVQAEHNRLVKEAKQEQVAQITHLGGYSAIGALLAAVAIYWVGEGAIVACLALALSSMLLFGYARFLDWKYYGWCVGLVVALGAAGLVVYLVRLSKNKEKAVAAEAIVKAIDEAYDECDTAGKEVIDTHILKRLTALGSSFDAIIKRIKASICDKVTDKK